MDSPHLELASTLQKLLKARFDEVLLAAIAEECTKFASGIAGVDVDLRWREGEGESQSAAPNLIELERLDPESAAAPERGELIALNVVHESQHLLFSFGFDAEVRAHAFRHLVDAGVGWLALALFNKIEDERIMRRHVAVNPAFAQTCSRYRELAADTARTRIPSGVVPVGLAIDQALDALTILVHKGYVDVPLDVRVGAAFKAHGAEILDALDGEDQLGGARAATLLTRALADVPNAADQALQMLS